MRRWRRRAAGAARALAYGVALTHGATAASADGEPPKSAFETVTVQRADVPVVRTLNGVVEAVNEATVSAQTSGRVGEILYDVDDVVPAGAVIIRLRGKEQRADLDRAEATLQEAIARDAEARARYERFSDMYERRVVPKATLDEALAARDSARAQVAAARAAVDRAREGVSYTEVRAPYGGIVTKRFVTVGESVSPGTPLMSGVSLDDLRVVVDVPQSLADAVRARQSAWIDVDGKQVPAQSVTVFPVAEPLSNTFRARVLLPKGTTAVRPGMFVKAVFATGTSAQLLVPETAVVERGELIAVYVVDAGNTPMLRQVKLGHRLPDGRVEILAGVDEGERLIREPAAALAQLRAATRPDG